MDILRQIPQITEMLPVRSAFYPISGQYSPQMLNGFEGREDFMMFARPIFMDQELAQFYGMKMKEGAVSFDLNYEGCLINETLAKKLGVPNPIGKTFLWLSVKRKLVVKSIVHDFQYQPPRESDRALYL